MADIKNLTVLPRPRSAWQAMDAGFTLARAHYVPLIVLWLGLSAPVFILCAVVQLWLGWAYMFFVWWWFKPLYELPLVFFLSKAVFSERISLRAAWKSALSQFWTLLKTYLTLARFSTARSLTYSVVFLEKLPRKQRFGRIQTLCAVKTRHYLLMLNCLHIEYIMAYAIIAFVAGVFFSSAIADIDWEVFFQSLDSPVVQKWLVAASVTTLIAGALVAPFYVAGGFLIYINRRMQLEAWDIEHRFRNIKPGTGKTANAAGLLLVVFLLINPDPTVAQQSSGTLITPVVAKERVQAILADEEFGSTKTQRVPKLKNKNDREEDDEESIDFDWSFFESIADIVSSLSSGLKLILWIAVIVFLGLLLHTLNKFRRRPASPSALNRRNADADDAQSHPLTQDLPTDVVAAAERLLASGQRRQALSVLFRGALRSVMDEHDLKIASGATETDCQKSVAAVASPEQTNTFSKLLGVWQKEAYANQPQEEASIRTLITDWKNAFSARAKATSGTVST